MKRRTKRSKAQAPTQDTRVDVPEDERVVGADGWGIRVGYVVRRRPFLSPTLGVEVPGVVGKVTRLYRCKGSDRVLVELVADARLGACGRYVTTPDRLWRSSAQVETEWVRGE